MPRSSSKKRAVPQAKRALPPRALPSTVSIISVEEFTSPKSGKTYSVFETNETDAYDQVKKSRSKKRAGRAKRKRGEGD
jgi:hypothetical protein